VENPRKISLKNKKKSGVGGEIEKRIRTFGSMRAGMVNLTIRGTLLKSLSCLGKEGEGKRGTWLGGRSQTN
jgi:hypothetical protein